MIASDPSPALGWLVGDDSQGYVLLHAATRGQAKQIALEMAIVSDYLAIRALRAPLLDGVAITAELAAEYLDLDKPEWYALDCHCPLCR